MSNVSRSRVLIPMVTNVNRLQGAKADWGGEQGGEESSLFMGENSPSQEAQDFGFGWGRTVSHSRGGGKRHLPDWARACTGLR